MDKLKLFYKKRKAFIIISLIGIILGAFMANITVSKSPTNFISEKENILAEINTSKEKTKNINEDIEVLKKKVSSLKEEQKKEELILKDKKEKIEKAKIEKANSSNKSLESSRAISNSSSSTNSNVTPSKPIGSMVYITRTGKKYHRTNHCGRTNPENTSYIPLSEAESMGYGPCSKCY